MTEQTESAQIESADTGESTDTGDAAAQTEQAVVAEALTVIDGALGQMMQRELISSGEVADLLLDVRSLLTSQSTTAPEGAATEGSTPEPVS